MTEVPSKPARSENLEVIMASDYWPGAKVTAIRGDEPIEIDIDLVGNHAGKDARLRAGDIVTLPRKEAAALVNSGTAKLPDME
jgi:hypothetical protein